MGLGTILLIVLILMLIGAILMTTMLNKHRT